MLLTVRRQTPKGKLGNQWEFKNCPLFLFKKKQISKRKYGSSSGGLLKAFLDVPRVFLFSWFFFCFATFIENKRIQALVKTYVQEKLRKTVTRTGCSVQSGGRLPRETKENLRNLHPAFWIRKYQITRPLFMGLFFDCPASFLFVLGFCLVFPRSIVPFLEALAKKLRVNFNNRSWRLQSIRVCQHPILFAEEFLARC